MQRFAFKSRVLLALAALMLLAAACAGTGAGVTAGDLASGAAPGDGMRLIAVPTAIVPAGMWHPDAVAVTPDGRWAITADKSGVAHLCQLDGQGQARHTAVIGMSDDYINRVDLSSDGRHLLTGMESGQVHLWQLDGKGGVSIAASIQAHEGGVEMVRFVPGNQVFLTSTNYDDEHIHLWRLAPGPSKDEEGRGASPPRPGSASR